MRVLAVLLLIFNFMFFPVSAQEGIEKDIIDEADLEKASEIIPESLKLNSDIEFNPTATPSKNGLNVSDIFGYVLKLTFKSIGEEVTFVLSLMAVFVIASIVNVFCEGMGKGGLKLAIHFCVSMVVCSFFITHVNGALSSAAAYTEELSVFVKGLLPFISSLSLMGGQVSTFAVMQTIILFAVTLLQNVLLGIAIPVCKIILAFSLIGYITNAPLGALSEFLSAFTTKLVTISFGILCAIIYFQNTVSSVTDSLALRSVKLAAGSFIPIVGGFVSEASGTLISGLQLVKSTFGVFAICVLIYVGAIPLINFSVKKLALKFINIVARLFNSSNEAKVVSELIGIYNILSAIMIASLCFFIFALSVFIKSEVG